MKYSISLDIPAAGNQISPLLLGVSCDLWGRHSTINEDYKTAVQYIKMSLCTLYLHFFALCRVFSTIKSKLCRQ